MIDADGTTVTVVLLNGAKTEWRIDEPSVDVSVVDPVA